MGAGGGHLDRVAGQDVCDESVMLVWDQKRRVGR
jgi:hypothetical protein